MKSLICIGLVLLLGTSIVNAGGSVEPEPSPANETAPATEPATTEPATTEPAATEPAATEPAATEQPATATAKVSSTKLLKFSKSKLDVAADGSASENVTTTDIQCQVPLCPSTPVAATVVKHNCTAYQQLNEACSADLACHPSFFCSNSSNTCVKKTSKGSSCTSLDECAKGTVCDHSVCIDLFSVAAGQAAESNLACASGIVDSGVCQNAELTSGAVPKKCANDGDCTADNGVTAGQCVCAEADNGQAYCSAHRSDQISLEHLRSAHEDVSEEVELSTFEYVYYPTLDVASECYKNSSELFANLAVLEQQATDCFAYFLQAAAMVVVMVLA